MQNIASLIRKEENSETRKHIDKVTRYFHNPRYYGIEKGNRKEVYAVYFGVFIDKRELFVGEIILIGSEENGKFYYLGKDVTFSQKRYELDIRLCGPDVREYIKKGKKSLEIDSLFIPGVSSYASNTQNIPP